MGFTNLLTAAYMICLPPADAPKDFEVQKLTLTQQSNEYFDMDVEYYTYGYYHKLTNPKEVELNLLSLPTPYGMEASSYEVIKELDQWYLYEYTLAGSTITRPIHCYKPKN